MPVFLNLPAGSDPTSETVAEIVAATPDGMMLVYTDGPGERLGFIDLADPSAPAPADTVDVGGEPTSVTAVGTTALAGVNTSESYTEPSGHVAVIDVAERTVAAQCDLGGQPDSVAASPDGRFLAVAIENERDEDLDDGVIPQLPAGYLAVLELDGDGRPINCDSPRVVELTGLADVAPDDPEPEYVDINQDNVAVVTLQENNHIALVDLATGMVTGHFSAGAVDLDAIDTEDDGIVQGTGTLSAVPREPDAVAWIDTERLATANEGDYEGGSRGFTIFSKMGDVLYDSGNWLEHLGMSHGHYPDGRADNKGVEPEGIEFGSYEDTGLIFVAAERGNFVAVFQDSGEGDPEFVQFLPTAVGPEGVLAIPARDLFVVASEVDEEENGLRSTLGIYARTADAAPYPTLVSDTDPATGAPIGWGAMSGLAADPSDPNKLHGVSDSYYGVSRIYDIDASQLPARITGYVDLSKDGEPAAYDLEGIAIRPGGFWLVSEGNPENDNPLQQRSLLLAVSSDGAVEQEIPLPDSVYEQAIRFGFEGVATRAEDDDEQVIVAVQRAWKDDPEAAAKLAIYSPSANRWTFVHYPLEAPKSERGGWVGLSEISHLGDGRFAILERDNQPGDYAAIKTITVIDLDGVTPVPHGEELPVVEKEVVIDLLPVLQSSRGWISDKPEGFAVTADGRVFAITDNDGVDNASSETLLLLLGNKEDLL
ncbi:MAG: esterase-like activity of phytase family protein [Pseudomonadota bacterium]